MTDQQPTFDIAIERPAGSNGTELQEFENVAKLMNVPGVGKAKVTYPDGASEMSPCGKVVSVKPHHDET